jgi:acyl-CoA reductase-like NAD-dependent aldehyde dehydrogenase
MEAVTAVSPTSGDGATVPRPFLLAGEPTAGSAAVDVVFPYDGSVVASVALADEDAAERALVAATDAREAIAAMAPFERADVLLAAAERVGEQGEELARQMTLETGNAIWETRLEVRRTAEILRGAAEEARRVAGEIVPIDAWPNGRGRYAHTRRFPVGPVLAITPYNAPLLLVAHKLGAALAAGNPCIVRPATKTPLSALSLGGILVAAGAPSGAVSVIPSRTDVAERLVEDVRVKMLSFTGSAEVGWHLRRLAKTPRVALELGGNGAVIVHTDANLEYAADRCAFGGFLRAGQACISVQRLYVQRTVEQRFTELFLERISNLTTGNPLDDSTVVGCLVDDAAAAKSIELIDEARAAGATVLCGGGRDGRVVEPTLLAGVRRDLRACATEAFAPIVVIEPYDDVDEAIRLADASPYGLQAGLFTNDIRIISRAFERLQVGALIVNDANTFRVDHMPYGGAKQSGHGREGVRYAIREMTEERLLVVDPR